jgi:hypothetical protein
MPALRSTREPATGVVAPALARSGHSSYLSSSFGPANSRGFSLRRARNNGLVLNCRMDRAELERRLQEAEYHVERGEQNIVHQRAVSKRWNEVGTTPKQLRCSSGDLRAPRANTLPNGVDCLRNWPTTPKQSHRRGLALDSVEQSITELARNIGDRRDTLSSHPLSAAIRAAA